VDRQSLSLTVHIDIFADIRERPGLLALRRDVCGLRRAADADLRVVRALLMSTLAA
jgi:hypothetical protein